MVIKNKFENLEIYIAAAWSGFFIMCLELLGGRLLAPYFGSSIFVWGAIITVFMVLLSIGYLLGGKLSARQKNPSITVLGFLLVGEAVLAIPVITVSSTVLEALSYRVPDPRYGSMLGSLMLFGMSTLVSGMIAPYAVRLLATDIQTVGSRAGNLYFWSTLGSASGTLITSFYLVLYFEIFTIIKIGMSLSISLGCYLILSAIWSQNHVRVAYQK